jgi:ABC-type transporter Mla subunit MlaD
LLEDSRIPKPEFGDIDESAAALLDAMLAQNDQIDSAFDEIEGLTEEAESAREEYFALENALPAGDPQLASARENWISLSQDLQSRLEAIDSVINQSVLIAIDDNDLA